MRVLSQKNQYEFGQEYAVLLKGQGGQKLGIPGKKQGSQYIEYTEKRMSSPAADAPIVRINWGEFSNCAAIYNLCMI